MTQTAPNPVQPTWQQWYPVAPSPVARRRVSTAGLVAACAGIVAVLVSFTTLSWFRDGTVRVARDDSGTFGIVHDALVRISFASGFRVEGEPIAMAYFSWAGWTLLLAAGAFAVLATVGTGATTAFRVLGGLVSLGALALTAAAIDLLDVGAGTDPGYGTYLEKTGPGFWTALAGFALLGLAAMIGSRRRA